MNYYQVPTELTLDDIRAKNCVFSPGMFRRATIPTSSVKRVADLLNSRKPFDKGTEPGSVWYMRHSTHYLIRTKALQEYTCLVTTRGNAITPLNPRAFAGPNLSDGDILMSKDSNVGECAVVDGNGWKNYMFSGGIVRLHPACDRLYFFSFLKHPLFKVQLRAMTARGATIAHAKKLWLDCLIPFPNQKDADDVMSYVSALMQAIVEKERTIRERSEAIHRLIQDELDQNQKTTRFHFDHPTLSEIKASGRLDAAIYDREYKSKIWLVENYARGFSTPGAEGFKVTPGPSLEIKVIGTRIDSRTYKTGFYALIIPTNISVYGTMNLISYLGTPKKLPLLQLGDTVFGEAGFHKGRSLVLLDGFEKCTTNAHGLYARRSDGDIQKSIFFRCIFNWYRSIRLIDLMAVGGSGGHFSPEYFHYVRIPKFPDEKQAQIAGLYHKVEPPPKDKPTLHTFVDWHRRWNAKLGIFELDREMRVLQGVLASVQAKIISGSAVTFPF